MDLLGKVNVVSLVIATFLIIIAIGATTWRIFKALEPYIARLINSITEKLDAVVKATEENTRSIRNSAYETKIARQHADSEREEIRNIQIENTKILQETIKKTSVIEERQEKDFKVLNDHEERLTEIELKEKRDKLDEDIRTFEESKGEGQEC